MLLLKQSTAATIAVGPFVDATDGFTPETGLAAGTVDAIGVFKAGATAITSISGTTTFTHRTQGMYTATLSTGDTDTLGPLVFLCVDTSVCRPVRHEYVVVPANVYDSLVSGSDYLDINALQVGGSTANATLLQQGAGANVYLSVASGTPTTTTFISDSGEATDDHFNGRVGVWLTGNLAGQAFRVVDYTGSTKTFTVIAMTEAPAVGDTFVLR